MDENRKNKTFHSPNGVFGKFDKKRLSDDQRDEHSYTKMNLLPAVITITSKPHPEELAAYYSESKNSQETSRSKK